MLKSAEPILKGPRVSAEGFVLERETTARMRFFSVSHAYRRTSTDRSLAYNANFMPLSTLTQHRHGVPDCPENVCGGTLVGGEDDDERACEPASAMRVDLPHRSPQWGVTRSARGQPLRSCRNAS